MRRCCPMGESVGSAFVVNLRVRPALVSLLDVLVVFGLRMPALRRLLLLFLGGDRGLFEKPGNATLSCGDCGPR